MTSTISIGSCVCASALSTAAVNTSQRSIVYVQTTTETFIGDTLLLPLE